MLVCSVFIAWSQTLTHWGNGKWTTVLPADEAGVKLAWDHAMSLFLIINAFLLALAGLVTGASGIGEEFERGSLHYLLTRPCSRRHFIWAGWLVGVAELLVIVLAGTAAAFCTLIIVTRAIVNWHLVAALPVLFVTAVLAYGLSHLLTLVTRNARNGLNAGIVFTVAYLIFIPFINYQWKLHVPVPTSMYTLFWEPGAAFPWSAVAGWLMIALAFPLAQQLLFERAEM